jgi:ectoine hydroxylase-related dioxygenase (phytanoyl-CoA dioxygenase family)
MGPGRSIQFPTMISPGNLNEAGYAIVPELLDEIECTDLAESFRAINGPGRRGLLQEPQFANIANSERIKQLVRPHVSGEPRAVRSIYFNKSPAANWAVSWHQDITIAVRERADVSGFQAWSVKKGVLHVQPPTEILERMLTVRIHLDDCDERNGALEVLPGSHLHGRLTAEQVDQIAKETTPVLCRVSKGGALLMRPLLLHSSRRSESTSPRRVLHIEYAGVQLPKPLEWVEEA